MSAKTLLLPFTGVMPGEVPLTCGNNLLLPRRWRQSLLRRHSHSRIFMSEPKESHKDEFSACGRGVHSVVQNEEPWKCS